MVWSIKFCKRHPYMVVTEHADALSYHGAIPLTVTAWPQRQIHLFQNDACYRWYCVTSIDQMASLTMHDDVIKCKHFPRYCPFVRGIHRPPVNSLHKGQWRGDLMFLLIWARMDAWVNNRKAGDLSRHCGHYDVTVMGGILRNLATLISLTSIIDGAYLKTAHTTSEEYVNIKWKI